MLAALAVYWAFLLLRVAVSGLFGIIALAWPGLTSTALVLLFGAYALTDGLLALIVALWTRGLPGFGSLLFEAMVRIGVGLLAFGAPGLAALAIVDLLAAWTVLSGIAALWASISLGRDLAGEWPLLFAGIMSILFGVMLVTGPGAPPDLQWVLGPYAILFAMTLLALTLQLRQLAYEIAST
jgi:uncharacterized membrane protein HdeD (DUF308 family)